MLMFAGPGLAEKEKGTFMCHRTSLDECDSFGMGESTARKAMALVVTCRKAELRPSSES